MKEKLTGSKLKLNTFKAMAAFMVLLCAFLTFNQLSSLAPKISSKQWGSISIDLIFLLIFWNWLWLAGNFIKDESLERARSIYRFCGVFFWIMTLLIFLGIGILITGNDENEGLSVNLPFIISVPVCYYLYWKMKKRVFPVSENEPQDEF